jgi:hypothetical protein
MIYSVQDYINIKSEMVICSSLDVNNIFVQLQVSFAKFSQKSNYVKISITIIGVVLNCNLF